ncbi:MAG: tetratricopeptide repeat protein [Planctomycetota bacterium]
MIAALLSACVLFGTQYAVQSAMMDAELAVLWLVGLIGFVVVASAIATRDDLPPGAMRAGLLGMSIAVLVHSQIEMAFALMATAGPAWFLVGLAGSGDGLASDARPRAGRGVASTLACGCVLSALVVAVFTSPVVRHQAQLAKASDYLYHGKPNHALAALEAAHTILPTDPTATRWIVTLRRDEMVSRAAMGDVAGARRAFALALQPIDAQLASTTPSASASRQRIGLLREASEAIGDPALLDEAIDLLHELAQRAPHGLSDAVLLGDLYWQRGDYTQAAAAYNRALDIDERLYLDPAMRLEAAERSRLVARLNEAASSTLQ